MLALCARWWRATAVAVALIGVTVCEMPATAFAQASSPQGQWKSTAGEAYFIFYNTFPWSCMFVSYVKGFNMQGNCEWNPSYVGGVLTIHFQWTRGPGVMAFTVIYIGPRHMTVNGEHFVRVR
jgi:hypothetical protein